MIHPVYQLYHFQGNIILISGKGQIPWLFVQMFPFVEYTVSSYRFWFLLDPFYISSTLCTWNQLIKIILWYNGWSFFFFHLFAFVTWMAVISKVCLLGVAARLDTYSKTFLLNFPASTHILRRNFVYHCLISTKMNTKRVKKLHTAWWWNLLFYAFCFL